MGVCLAALNAPDELLHRADSEDATRSSGHKRHHGLSFQRSLSIQSDKSAAKKVISLSRHRFVHGSTSQHHDG